jgi:hypothetical protein
MTLQHLITRAYNAFKQGQLQDVEHILELLAMQATSAPVITATPDTLVACATCHDTDAPEYRLRRVMGRYVLLCFKNGDGCWERSPRPTCSFKDDQGVHCQIPAEVRITYGEDQTTHEDVCALHVGAMLTPAHGKITVYPLEV